MVFNYTGLVYFVGFLIFGFLTHRNYKNWKSNRSVFSKDFVFLGICFALFCLLTSVGAFFFSQNPQFLKFVVVSATFLQGLAMAFFAHLVFYLKFPRISPWIGFSMLLVLTLVATFITASSSFSPFLSGKTIDWNFPLLSNILRGVILLLGLIPISIVFFKDGLASSIPEVKRKTAIFMSIFGIGFLIIMLQFFFGEKLGVSASFSDFLLLFVYFGALALIFVKPEPNLQNGK